jgi:hypothetical protein
MSAPHLLPALLPSRVWAGERTDAVAVRGGRRAVIWHGRDPLDVLSAHERTFVVAACEFPAYPQFEVAERSRTVRRFEVITVLLWAILRAPRTR